MNTAFRECCLLIIDRLGLGQPEAGYLDELEALNEACAEWHRVRAPKFGFLVLHLPEFGDRVMTGNLDLAERAGFCGNEAARDFVRFIDCQTKHRCTLLMLQIVSLLQTAIASGAAVNAPGGRS
jgi:hypothetical protein